MRPPIRQAGPEFADLMGAIHAAAFPADPWDVQAFARLLELPATFGLVAQQRGLVLASVAADESEILTLAVVPESRRRGVGAALLDAAMQLARGRGAQSMHLEVAELNRAAGALYASRGFRQVGRRETYYANGGNALVLSATLNGRPCAAGHR